MFQVLQWKRFKEDLVLCQDDDERCARAFLWLPLGVQDTGLRVCNLALKALRGFHVLNSGF